MLTSHSDHWRKGLNAFAASIWASILVLIAATPLVRAGPPFVTDDPEPVKYRHWEVYVASQDLKTADGWSGTAPHVEVNYGVITNVQLHLIAPLAYDAPKAAASHYGYGDTEVGLKCRFIQETAHFPQAGVFPLLELPSGDAERGLGSGHVQAFLPLWLQKDFGSWTLYGGGGYGINPGAANRDWTFFGAVTQCQVTERILVGGELYHRTAAESGGRADTAFNLGTVVDFTHHHHLLFSVGRSIDGPAQFQVYLAYQFTFGPHFFSKHRAPRLWGSPGP
jgi:hypothetical protein